MKNNSQGKIKLYTCYALMICIGLGVVLHIVPYFFNRSLWVDEAMLTSSICTRSYGELIASPLDWGQSAAVGYLFVVKTLTLIFGTSETVLRIWSLITGLGCIFLIYYILKDKVEKHYALFFTALFSLTDKFIYYGNEVKPYMSDNLCCLLTLLLWQKHKEGKVPLWKLVVIYSVLIWFSFSAVFFVAACMIIKCIELFVALFKDKDKKQLKNLGICAIVLVSFVALYIIWLSKTSDNVGGAAYWDLLRFPLIPTSLSDVELIIKMAWQFLHFYPLYVAGIICALFVLYVAMSFKERKDKTNILFPFVLSLLILFVASYLGFYPIQDRLVQVYAIILLFFAAYACNEIEHSHNISAQAGNGYWMQSFYYIILLGCMFLVGKYGLENFDRGHVYRVGSEIEKSVEYLEKNMTDDDVLYVYRKSIPVYTYEIDYDMEYTELSSIPYTEVKSEPHLSGLPYVKENIIYGQSLIHYFYQVPYSYAYEVNQAAIEEDAALITQYDSVYIFASHGESGLSTLLETLENTGNIQIVCQYHGTTLYRYIRE